LNGERRILVKKPLRKSSLERSRRRWTNSIKMGLWEIDSEVVNWIEVAQDHIQMWVLVLVVLNL
jgi:hypothetical protein